MSRRERCECPFLASCAESDRLAGTGTGIEPFEPGIPILVGLLRDRHGCPGSTALADCPWAARVSKPGDFRIRRPRPLYRGEDTDDDDGRYL